MSDAETEAVAKVASARVTGRSDWGEGDGSQ